MAEYLICFDRIPMLTIRSPNSLSNPPYCIDSLNPFIASMSSFQPDELQPFHEAFAGVMKFINEAKTFDFKSLVFLKELFKPCCLSHFMSNAFSEIISS